jgi:hypothetical protein
MSQFQAEIPHPLANHLPQLLPTSCMGTPTIRILLFVLIREDGRVSPSMQVESQDIGRGEGSLWQSSKEEFVNALISCHSDGSSRRSGRMSGNDDPTAGSCWSKKDIRAIEEGTADPAFGMGCLLIR